MADDASRLRADCDLAWTTWMRQTGGMQLMVLRERGAEDFARFKIVILGMHQEGHYMEGLKKLGIGGDPPAIAAAKYHYLSNSIGGLTLEYAEDGPKKAWIRYTQPAIFYHGLGLLAVPSKVQRAVFQAWHAKNAEYMNCPRLGYVCTKFYQDGEPYDEGYFIEYDHDIGPEWAVRYIPTRRSPEFDPAKTPKLDAAIWPEARLLKAKRKYGGGYVRTTFEAMWSAYGLKPAAHMMEQALSLVAVQYVHELKARKGIAGNTLDDVTRFLAAMLAAREDEVTVEKLGNNRTALALRTLKPFDPDFPEELKRAYFAFPFMCVRIMNGHIRFTRRTEIDKGGRTLELWELEDTGRWLF